MKIFIEKKYLIAPIGAYATTKKLCFYECIEGERRLRMDFDCKLDLLNPTYTAYIDVSRYRGMELEYCTIPHMEFTLEQSDEKSIEGVYREEFRPFVHFTPQIGWINDPNGMIRYGDTYHMFYQYNPFGVEWGNMHWGHATSRDMINWEEQEIALYPDEMGTMYSGSALEDVSNVTGLKENENNPFLLFYTAAGNGSLLSKNKPRTQCLAYSTDGGKSFEKYQGNPVVERIESYNRDPKVVWVEELSRYVMALYLVGERYALLTSENLLDWKPLQEIVLENESECPDLMRFKVNGKAYWVISGASDKYIIGAFEKGVFVQKNTTKQLNYSPSRTSYAAQSFSGLADGRTVRFAWERIQMPSQRVPNQMSIPTEMRLVSTPEGCYLEALPVKELELLYEDTYHLENATLAAPLELPLCRAAYDINLVADHESNITVEVFGHRLKINIEANCIEFQKVKVPLSLALDAVKFRMIVDRCSIEIFADNGKFCATFPVICDYNLPYLRIQTEDEVTVRRLDCSKLKSIYNENNEGGVQA